MARTRNRRLHRRAIPLLLCVGAVMTLGAAPAGELFGTDEAEAALTTTSNSGSVNDCQVKGSTFVDGNANGRFDAGETGLAGAVLTIRGRTNWFQATADRSGRFSVAGLPTGPVVINIESPRAAERFGPARRSINVGSRCVSLDSIAMVPEQTEFASYG